jgi:hypothetical protein
MYAIYALSLWSGYKAQAFYFQYAFL